jgi:predicted nucleic acid-binding protein
MVASTEAVIDSSRLLSWIFPDEKTSSDPLFDIAQSGSVRLVAPTLIAYEVANALKSGLVSKGIHSGQLLKLCQDFTSLRIIYVDLTRYLPEVIQLAASKNLSTYDASYLFLAKQRQCPLYTLDNRLAEAATDQAPSNF